MGFAMNPSSLQIDSLAGIASRQMMMIQIPLLLLLLFNFRVSGLTAFIVPQPVVLLLGSSFPSQLQHLQLPWVDSDDDSMFMVTHTTRQTLSLSTTGGGGGLGFGESPLRQYVPILVIALVVMDMIMGSPLLKSLLATTTTTTVDPIDSDTNNTKKSLATSTAPHHSEDDDAQQKPRMDIDTFAQQALERAEGVIQLNAYLESRKTDWDRMEDLKRKINVQMDTLDHRQQEQTSSLSSSMSSETTGDDSSNRFLAS